VTIHLICLLNILVHMKRSVRMWKCRVKVSFPFLTVYHQVVDVVSIVFSLCSYTQSMLSSASEISEIRCVLSQHRLCGGNDEWSQWFLGFHVTCYWSFFIVYLNVCHLFDRLCDLVVRVLGYRSGGPGSIPGTTKKKSSGSGTGSTQPREYNWVATW
jgi:hypothetical protein